MNYKAVNNILNFLSDFDCKQVTILNPNRIGSPLCFLISHIKNYHTNKMTFTMIDHDGVRFAENTESYSEGLNSCLIQWFNYHFLKFPIIQTLLKNLSEGFHFQGLIVFTKTGYQLQYHPQYDMLKTLSELGFEHEAATYKPTKSSKKKKVIILKQIRPFGLPSSTLEVIHD